MLRLASKRLLGLGFGEALSSSSAAKLLLPRLYHERVVDHYNNPRNVGSFDKNDPTIGTGLVGAPACGDVMKLQIKVDDQTGKIVDACFKTFGCGSAIASSSVGNFHWTLEDVAKSIVCIMSCPCQAGYTQMLNDWYDREIDAVNEPYRPIPSGAISENEETSLLKFFPLGDYPNLGTAFGRPWVGWFIGCVGQGIAFGRSFPSYIYSAQPLKLEESKFVFEATIIQRMKLLVLSTLQWKMNSLTPFSFVDHIARRFGLKTDLH